MTREEQIERVASELATALDGRPHRRLAERIVDALAQPVEDTSESVQAKVDRMRDLTESVSERNQRIERLKGEPVEVTDEMVERAWNAGQDDLPVGQRWDKPALRIALRAALEAGPWQ